MKHRFLIVDDDALVNRTAQEVLQLNFDCEVDLACTPDEAQALFARHKEEYSLAVCDLNLPRVGGLELCRAFRKEREQLPIIVLTAYASDKAYEEASQIGINEFIQKPFNPVGFIEVVKKLLDSQDKRQGRLRGFETQFLEQVDLILSGRIPAGCSSLDFILRVLKKNSSDTAKIEKMERLIPLLKTEISFMEARDNYMYLKALQDQRVERIRTLRQSLFDQA